jgi:hypothetical protein
VSTNPTKIYGVGGTYQFPPINITESEFQGAGDITFTMKGAPDGFLIDPTTGYIKGTPTTATKENLMMEIYAVNGAGDRTETPLQTIVFDVREGPNGEHCLNNGKIVDDGGSSFTCDCNQTITTAATKGFNGPNCGNDIEKEDTENEKKAALLEAEASAADAEAALMNTKKAQNETRAAEVKAAAQSSKAKADKQQTSFTTGLAAGGAIVLILLIIAAVKYQQHRIAMRPVDFASLFAKMVDSGDISAEQMQVLASNQGESTGTFATQSANLPREIPRRCITKSEKVGEGAFGEVFKGILDETSNNHGVPGYLVACKSVTDPTGDGAADLLQEATVMAQIGTHINLVSLIGVVTSGVPLLIIIALCENGSLKGQLEKRVLGEGKLAAKPGVLPPKIDADIGLEIARGMLHLVEHHLVHRDLAARNVLLDSQLVCKVADFGLSRAFSGEEGKDYYKSTTGMMALRWTAPEAMTTLKFSMATDVWAFGIVLLEIAINGELPVKELTNAEIMAQMQSGYKTPKPTGCSDAMYEVMCKCWTLDPVSRPSFLDLADILSEGDFEGAGFAAGPPAGKAKAKGRTSNNPTYAGGAGAGETISDSGYVVQGSAGTTAGASAGLYAANPSSGQETIAESGYVVQGSAGTAGASAGLYATNETGFNN